MSIGLKAGRLLVVSSVSAAFIAAAGASPAMAAEPTSDRSVAVAEESPSVVSLSDAEMALLDLTARAGAHMSLDSAGSLQLAVSDQQLRAEGYSDSQIGSLRAVVARANTASPASDESSRGWGRKRVFHVSHSGLQAGAFAALTAAAQVSPAALMVAWTVFSAAMGGPLAIGAAVLGGTFFTDMAVKIVGALGSRNMGISTYAKWGIPPLETVVEP